MTTKELCAKHNISPATFYAWKRKYGDMDVDEVRRLKAMESEEARLKRIVTDITGVTGLAILNAIVAGERDPKVLAGHRDYRCKKSEAQIAKALHGDWRKDTLRQSLEAWRFHQRPMADCEQTDPRAHECP